MDQGIRGYPSLKVFKGGDPSKALEYEGGRTAESIINYMVKQSLPSVQVFDDEKAFEELLKESVQPVVVFNGDKNLNQTFHKVADSLFNEFTFASFDGAKEYLAVHLPNEDEPISFKGDRKGIEKSADDLEAWIKIEGLPYFGEVNGQTFGAYVESGLPLAYFFYNDDDERKEYSSFFTKLGKEYRGKLSFAGLDARKFGRHAENLNMKEQFPLFAIHNMSSNLKYGVAQLPDEKYEKLDKPLKLSTKEVSKLVNDVVSGKAEPIVKSEEIPEKQESNVIKIVGKTHDQLIEDNKKDVLVKYYAPWCGHCKRLAPIYEQLADILASDDKTSKSFVIGDIDATENDVPGVDLEGYPTIILYPAGKNSKPVVFEQERSVESFLAFLKKNGGTKLDLEKVYEKYQAEQKKADEDESDETGHDEL
ncbi:protein disulfide-isomerase [Zygosaccharomyces rouxii]|nr:protein disulfide-isomerase [Zygosaccharomyces rouxii]